MERCGGPGDRRWQAEPPFRQAIGAEVEARQAGTDLELDEMHRVVGFDTEIGREHVLHAEPIH